LWFLLPKFNRKQQFCAAFPANHRAYNFFDMKNLILLAFCLYASLASAQEQPKSAEGYPAPAQPSRTARPPRPNPNDDKGAPSVYFNLQLNKLKNAYKQGDLANLIASEQRIQDLIRKHTQDVEAKITAKPTPPQPERQARLDVMKRVLTAFDGHSFDLGKPAVAEKDFALLDEFAKVLSEEAEATN
jgi:hypothetical protein